MAKSSKEKFDMSGFLSSVKKKEFSPIYFFYGEETFFIEECVDAVLDAAVDSSMKEFNLDILQGGDIDGKKLISIATAYPMMAERRVVVVKDFERVVKKDVEDILAYYVEHPSPTTILILVANAPDLRKKPYPSIKKHAVCGEMNALWDNEMLAWIESRLKKTKRSFEPHVVELLHSYIGNSLREAVNEIEKLMIAVDEKSMITAKDVERVVGVSKEFTVFELANKVGEKNIQRAVEIAERLLNSGES
ncbi:MAG: DNA polymerase III subunit delta, partial [Bacteroidota bacterium]|nr:DNA polymerase III subunit delta [Bacteroidota bacterium]